MEGRGRGGVGRGGGGGEEEDAVEGGVISVLPFEGGREYVPRHWHDCHGSMMRKVWDSVWRGKVQIIARCGGKELGP